eukprot:CAMPEP_0174337548 /NCGR_PEP_ID=MMETSP0810-20121108/22414_1 /TAXON_ID=73025 ORGANISM="Eutreptiella gymnastica-like, Strain CCMP1594" /NCGR_SAMPLE_ID=MMETSP0810 /ASSEMBLY_ACC=CAM_ASM_000659 /LENGTH=128 /DNA_ID=CAMNT_0015457079 /DNA_START=841 /DNA_END=1223 /DNA_ORIENTATION=+
MVLGEASLSSTDFRARERNPFAGPLCQLAFLGHQISQMNPLSTIMIGIEWPSTIKPPSFHPEIAAIASTKRHIGSGELGMVPPQAHDTEKMIWSFSGFGCLGSRTGPSWSDKVVGDVGTYIFAEKKHR